MIPIATAKPVWWRQWIGASDGPGQCSKQLIIWMSSQEDNAQNNIFYSIWHLKYYYYYYKFGLIWLRIKQTALAADKTNVPYVSGRSEFSRWTQHISLVRPWSQDRIKKKKTRNGKQNCKIRYPSQHLSLTTRLRTAAQHLPLLITSRDLSIQRREFFLNAPTARILSAPPPSPLGH